MSLEDTYNWFDIATIFVITGVAIEELYFFIKVRKFFIVWRKSGFKEAWDKAHKHKKEIIEGSGFLLLIIGLTAELQLQSSARIKEGQRLASVGVAVGQLSEYVTEAETIAKGAQAKVAQMEAQAQKGTPPTPPPVVVTPPPIVVSHARKVTAKAREIILATVKPRAIISIIPYLPGEPENFAEELASAFRSVKDVQVAVGSGNLIMNGTTGLYLQYDHRNPVSTSVYSALAKAGFNPTSGPDTPGDIVFIKVAPAEQ